MNQVLPSLHGGSLKNTLTVPLIDHCALCRNKERFQDDVIFLTFIKYTEGEIEYLDLIQFIR